MGIKTDWLIEKLMVSDDKQKSERKKKTDLSETLKLNQSSLKAKKQN